MKIQKNFLVVSNYNNDISWVAEYTDNYLVYDKSDNGAEFDNLDKAKIIKSPNVGYNLADYFDFIISNYDHLPDCVIFVKGNVFPRHVSREFFERLANNDWFTPIVDYRCQTVKFPFWLMAADGGFLELNNDRYLRDYILKYFSGYNDFIRFCFKEPIIPKYLYFAPGANYVVPRANILKLPKVVYENLKLFISYCQLPGEAHIIERALQVLWTSNFELNKKILKPIDELITPMLLPGKKQQSIGWILPLPIKKIAGFLYAKLEKLDKYV